MKNRLYYYFNKSNVYNFNWGKVLVFFTFFTYGFYAVISKFNNEIFTVVTIICLIYFYIISKKNEKLLTSKFIFKNYEILNVLLFLLILTIINYEFLNLSLFGDELAHTIRASRTSIYTIITLIEKFDLTLLYNIKFQHLVNILNFFLLIFLLLIIFLIYKHNGIFTILFLVFITIIFRFFLKDFGMHPPLDHIFSFVLFSIVGISDFTANFSYLLGFSILQFFIFRLLKNRNFSYIQSLLATISIFTIPLLLEMSTWTEPGIWASTFFIIILLELFYVKEIDYLKIIIIISIATLFRISIFITLLPLILFYLNDKITIKNINYSKLKEIFLVFSPICIFLPFLFNSVFIGTPSFTALGQKFDNEISFFNKLLFVIDTNIIWITVLNSISYIWLIFIPFIFISNSKKFKNLILLIYILFSLIVFYSINQNLWGLAKYAGEYALPLCVLGFVNFLSYLKEIKFNKNLINFCLISIIVINFYQFKNIHTNNKAQDQIIDTFHQDIKKINNNLKLFNYKLVYNLKDSFKYIDKKNMNGNTYLIGTTYGFLPEILNGYNVKEILKTKKIIENQEKLKLGGIRLSQRLALDQNIKAILLTDVPNIQNVLNDLQLNGWKIEKKFKNLKYGSTVYLLFI